MANITSGVLDRLKQMPSFKPTASSVFGDWSVEAGDIVTVKNGDTNTLVPVFSNELSWNGSTTGTIESTGSAERTKMTKSERQNTNTRRTSNYAVSRANSVYQSYTDEKGDLIAEIRAVKTIVYGSLSVKKGLTIQRDLYLANGDLIIGQSGRFYPTQVQIGEILMSKHSHTVTVNSNGVLTIGGPSSEKGNFNIADTQFFKYRVSAAKSTGYNSGRKDYKPWALDDETISAYSTSNKTINVSFTMLNEAGDSLGKFAAIGVDASKFYNEAYNAGKSSGSSIDASAIDLTGFSWVDSTSTFSISGKTRLSALQSMVATHKNDRGYIYWTARLAGQSGYKTYFISIG